jgi:hypothetical protein
MLAGEGSSVWLLGRQCARKWRIIAMQVIATLDKIAQ